MYRHFFKRLIDIFVSLIGIIVLALPMLIIALIIKIDSPCPAFFNPNRFDIYKKTWQIQL